MSRFAKHWHSERKLVVELPPTLSPSELEQAHNFLNWTLRQMMLRTEFKTGKEKQVAVARVVNGRGYQPQRRRLRDVLMPWRAAHDLS